MSKIKLFVFMILVGALAVLAPIAALAQLPSYADPGGVPHYFGPFGNWAFSPLPKGPIATVAVVEGGTGYSAPVVTITDAYLLSCTDPSAPLSCYTAADVSATLDADGAITGFTINSPGDDYVAPVVTITDPAGGGTGALADAVIGGTLTGGMLKFVDPLPGIPLAVPDVVTYPGSHYYEIALRDFSESMHSSLPLTKMRGYVQLNNGTDNVYDAATNTTGCVPPGQPLPDLGLRHCSSADNIVPPAPIGFLGPVIVAQGRAHGVQVPDTSDPGDPIPVRIKFYNQLPAGADGDLFIPVDETVMGAGYGPAGPGGAGDMYTQNRATIHLHGNNTVWISDGNVHQWITPADEITPYPKGVSVRNVPDMLDSTGAVQCDDANSGCMTFFYTNAQSARLQFYHDHAMGITRLNVYAGEAAGYVLTDAVEDDMINGTNVSGVYGIDSNGDPVPGSYTPVLPGLGIPLVIQDRTFVDAETIWAQDPTWNSGTGLRDPATGKITEAVTGDLWYPHVYMSVQNPWDLTGTNAFGRWHYGPWFNPPVPTCVNGQPVGCIEVGPVPNPYYQAICDTNPADPTCTAPWEPPLRPGVPNPSMPGESFLDTPIVNGMAYPYLVVEPKAYRFRILNAANDRMFNLQLYEAYQKSSWVPGTGAANPGSPTVPCSSDPTGCTEVKMVPVNGAPNQFADTPSGIPDPTTAGPPWIMIGTEGGWMPKPVVVPQQPIGYNLDPAYFSFGLVNQKSLFLGSAERADVIVDFSAYAGQTLILYNDSPAPVPAGAAPYDNYTGNGNQMDGGGAPNTQPGYGPNTRTIMQIRVAASPTTPYDLDALNAVFAKTDTKRGVFELTQDPIIIPQADYNSAYNNSFPTSAAGQYIQIAELEKTFQPIDEAGALQPPVTLPLEMKAMHDEMGGVYDTLFGRMSGMLGLSLPNSPNHVLIPYPLASPPTDLVKGSVEGTPIGVMPDGTQIWRIFHNGVDTHTIHTHLFHTQLINRVDQSGQVTGGTLPVDSIELGWKDTFRVNPLEITYLAMRPTVPTPDQVPFEVPDSWRLIDPTMPEGATLIPPPPAGWFDPAGNFIPEILNHYVNFGWEYVWHCHILSHEEMDMMHSLVFAVPPTTPTDLALVSVTGNGNRRTVTLTWTDNSLKEAQFTIQRAADANFTTGLTTFNYVNPSTVVPNTVTFQDTTARRDNRYWYRVFAIGSPVGDLLTPGFPTMSADSVSDSLIVEVGTPPGLPELPGDPTDLQAVAPSGPPVSLGWTDNATNETGFVVERCTVVSPATTCGNFAQIAAPGALAGTGLVTYVDPTVAGGNTYSYRVKAVNGAGSSAYSNTSTVAVTSIPAPADFIVTNTPRNGANTNANLSWLYGANPTSFTIQRATNATFTSGLNTANPGGAVRSLTQSVNQNTTYYYRIRANTSAGSSDWTNALPFPIRTGNQ